MRLNTLVLYPLYRGSIRYSTVHAMLMLFFFIMPAAMSGLGNLLIPLLLSTPEMAFPKVNNIGVPM